MSVKHEFFEVVTLDEALAHRERFGPRGVEQVALGDTVGRVLAEDVAADADVPGFARSTMDGYAVRAASTFGASDGNAALLEVVGSVPMGERTDLAVGPGQAARIATGGMLPSGADAVVMVEHTEVVDPRTIEAYRSAAPAQHVVARGDDVRVGDVLLKRGSRLRPQEVGLLAALGHARAGVFSRPVVAIISTGDEVVPVDVTPGPGQIRDVNSYTLSAAVAQAGATAKLEGIVPDDFEALQAAAERAVAEADVVLLSGGSSVGARDYTLDVIRALPDAEVLVHGVSIKPGKPTILARVGTTAFWGLPGHVTSAMVVYRVLVSRFVDTVAGVVTAADGEPRRVRARLRRNVPSVHGRVDFVRVRLEDEDGQLFAEPVLGPSGLLRTMVLAEGLVEIGLNTEGLDEGSDVWVLPM
jgi:molybdopterin molybdotransferase